MDGVLNEQGVEHDGFSQSHAQHRQRDHFSERAGIPPDGLGGKRTAWVDEIRFLPVPDVAVRIAGVESGEYHFAQIVKPDQYDRLKLNPKLELPITSRGKATYAQG